MISKLGKAKTINKMRNKRSKFNRKIKIFLEKSKITIKGKKRKRRKVQN